ncbi:MAG: hypothetical protein WA183_01135 [Chthoniobacterales bacterium]
MRIKLSFFAGALFAAVGGVAAGPVELEPKETAPPPTITSSEPWYFNIGMPGWLAGVSGDVGLHGITSHVDVGFDKIIRQVDGTASFSAEARKGQFGVYGDFLYLSLVASVYPNGLVSSANLGVDEYLADGEVYYRVLEGPRGWLDLRAGARYTNLYNTLKLVGDGPLIDQAATNFVNALPGAVRALLERRLQGVLDGRNPSLPIPPLGFDEKAKLLALILAAKRDPDPMRAQRKIAGILNKGLNRSFSLTEYWFDPYIGIGGRYKLTKAFYVTAKVDVGGFGAGSDITTQASGAIGCQVTRRIYSELGFRYLYVDYNSDGFLYKTSTYGPQITTGITF